MVTLKDIQEAAERIAPFIRCTCLLERDDAAAPDTRALLKPENLQVTGSFKLRGAANCLAGLTPQERERGVTAASAGNHAQGVAAAARALGIHANVFMPETTPLLKVDRTRRYGARVTLTGKDFDAAYAAAQEASRDCGCVFVHPFADPRVIAGQGTVGLEILRDAPDITSVVVPVGGGGLIAGVAVAVKEQAPHVPVFGVQTQASPAMAESFAAGQVVCADPGGTIAEGIAVGTPCEDVCALVRRYVDDIIAVPEAHIARAMLRLVEDEKLVVEGAGAAPYAALEALGPRLGKRPVLVLSGGNVDVTVLGAVIDRGLAATGRSVRLLVDLPDRPGALADLARVISETRANIIEIYHNRLTGHVEVGRAEVELVLSTRGQDHVQDILAALHEAGYEARAHE